jgi:hypothetical protein
MNISADSAHDCVCPAPARNPDSNRDATKFVAEAGESTTESALNMTKKELFGTDVM